MQFIFFLRLQFLGVFTNDFDFLDALFDFLHFAVNVRLAMIQKFLLFYQAVFGFFTFKFFFFDFAASFFQNFLGFLAGFINDFFFLVLGEQFDLSQTQFHRALFAERDDETQIVAENKPDYGRCGEQSEDNF